MLRDTDKSQYFATIEFNNCFIIRSPSLFFVIIFGKSLSDSSGKGSARVLPFSVTHEQNIICSKTQLDSIAHEQTIICRQLFAGHVVCSRPMKRKGKIHRMIIQFGPIRRHYHVHLVDN